MDQSPLVTEQIDAGARFIAGFQKYRPVRAAFWLRDADDGEWSLYVISDQIRDDNFDVAYGEVLRVAGNLRDPWFDPFQVKLIGLESPLAKAMLEVQGRSPSRPLVPLHGKTFDGMSVEEVYFYRPPVAVPAS